jgi:hypothetical protein
MKLGTVMRQEHDGWLTIWLNIGSNQKMKNQPPPEWKRKLRCGLNYGRMCPQLSIANAEPNILNRHLRATQLLARQRPQR